MYDGLAIDFEEGDAEVMATPFDSLRYIKSLADGKKDEGNNSEAFRKVDSSDLRPHGRKEYAKIGS